MFQTTNQLGHVLLRGTEDGMIDQHVKTESDRIRVQVHIPLSLFGWLVVLTILKKIVNGKDYPIYYGKKLFETTNQLVWAKYAFTWLKQSHNRTSW